MEVVGTQSLPVIGLYLVRQVFVVESVGVVFDITAITPVPIVESFFLVRFPTNPVPFVSPIGARVSSLYLFWNLMTAFVVAGPK